MLPDTDRPVLLASLCLAGFVVIQVRCVLTLVSALIEHAWQVLIAGIFNPRSHIPGPWHTRFTAAVVSYHRLAGRKHFWVQSMHQKYGPMVRIAPDDVSVGHIDPFSEVHRMGSPFRKGALHSGVRFTGRENLFSMTNVKAHAARRKLFSRVFTAKALRANWESRVRAIFERGIAKMKRHAADDGSVDIWKWWRLITSDAIAELAFSHTFNMIETGRDSEYMVALQNAGTNIILKAMFPFAELLRFLPWQRIRNIMNATKVLQLKGAEAIAEMRNGETQSRSLFSNIMAEAEHDEKGLITFEDMNEEAALFLVAGAETTASTLTCLVWAVQQKPDLQQRLEQEVGALGPDFTDEDLEKLPLLNDVISETMRLYNPASASTPRRAPAEGAVIGGYAIPGNSTVSTHMWTICRDPSIYPDPDWYVASASRIIVQSQAHNCYLVLTRLGSTSRLLTKAGFRRLGWARGAALEYTWQRWSCVLVQLCFLESCVDHAPLSIRRTMT